MSSALVHTCDTLEACRCLDSLATVKSWHVSRLSFPLSWAPLDGVSFDVTLASSPIVELWGTAKDRSEAVEKIAKLAQREERVSA